MNRDSRFIRRRAHSHSPTDIAHCLIPTLTPTRPPREPPPSAQAVATSDPWGDTLVDDVAGGAASVGSSSADLGVAAAEGGAADGGGATDDSEIASPFDHIFKFSSATLQDVDDLVQRAREILAVRPRHRTTQQVRRVVVCVRVRAYVRTCAVPPISPPRAVARWFGSWSEKFGRCVCARECAPWLDRDRRPPPSSRLHHPPPLLLALHTTPRPPLLALLARASSPAARSGRLERARAACVPRVDGALGDETARRAQG